MRPKQKIGKHEKLVNAKVKMGQGAQIVMWRSDPISALLDHTAEQNEGGKKRRDKMMKLNVCYYFVLSGNIKFSYRNSLETTMPIFTSCCLRSFSLVTFVASQANLSSKLHIDKWKGSECS